MNRRTVSQAVADGVTDASATIQAEIDALAVAGGGLLELPGGVIIAEGLILRDRVNIKGAGGRATTIRPLVDGTAEAILSLAPGPVQMAFVSDLALLGRGSARPGMHGFHMRALSDGYHGGWWLSGMARVYVDDFAGNSIWLHGGTDTMTPNQFLAFESVYAYADPSGRALHVEGQNAQVTYDSCTFDGGGLGFPGATGLVNAWVEGSAHVFDACTFQQNTQGLVVNGAKGVVLNGCWFENLGRAVTATNGGKVTLAGTTFANAASMGDGTGYAAKADGYYSTVTSIGSVLLGKIEQQFVAGSARSYVDARDTYSSDPLRTTGMTKQLGIDPGGVLNVGNAGSMVRTALVNGSTTPISTVNSTMEPGGLLHVKAWGGALRFATGGNIDLGGNASPLVVPAGAVVTLARFDLGVTWQVVSVSTL